MFWPYFTVLYDSFHEALVSRVLWILIILATLFMLAILPISLYEKKATDITMVTMRNPASWDGLLRQMQREAKRSAASPGKHLWSIASDEFKAAVERLFSGEAKDGGEQFRTRAITINEFNKMLANPKFYDKKAFADVVLDEATKKELAKDYPGMTGDDQKHFHRKLLKAAYPLVSSSMPLTHAELAYLWYSTPLPGGAALDFARTYFGSQTLPFLMNWIVGPFGVFAAILVTASIIPKTFESGAIDLLLSKPVTRTLLFLVKFLGGCAFILLLSTYFIVGTWLILGTRIGIWKTSLLWCIPVFMFMFLIYYAVSAFAAVVWRNSIVSVVVTILFWGACASMGLAKSGVEFFAMETIKIERVVPTDSGIVTLNASGQFNQWAVENWQVAIDAQGPGPFGSFPPRAIRGPIYDDVNKRMVFLVRPVGASPAAFYTWQGGKWVGSRGPTPPPGVREIFITNEGRLLAMSSLGPIQLGDNPGMKVLGIQMPFGGSDVATLMKEDNEVTFSAPLSAIDDEGNFVVYSNKKLYRLKREDDGKYTVATEAPYEGDEPERIAVTKKVAVTISKQGEVRFFDAENLNGKTVTSPTNYGEPAQLIANKNTFAARYENGGLVVFDEAGKVLKDFGGKNLAIAFNPAGNLVVADRVDRVTTYNMNPFEAVETLSPPEDTLRIVYRFAVWPIYTIFPKPGELTNVVSYVLADDSTSNTATTAADFNIYSPLINGFAFVFVLMFITCVYLQWIDI